MTTSSELAETLSSIESIKSYLAGLVSAASDNRDGAPVRLTYVGGEFAKALGVPFDKHITALADQDVISVAKNRRKLAHFVKDYCKDIFTITEDPIGVYFVSPLSQPVPITEGVQPARVALRFHRAIWAAFIRPIEGKRRFLNLEKIGFTDAIESPPDGDWREIQANFVLGLAPGAPVDGVDLQSRIEAWAKAADVPVSQLILDAKPPRELGRRLEQLFDIIDALPASVAAAWSIPVVVLKHLRDAR